MSVVWECGSCGTRSRERRCEECNLFCSNGDRGSPSERTATSGSDLAPHPSSTLSSSNSKSWSDCTRL